MSESPSSDASLARLTRRQFFSGMIAFAALGGGGAAHARLLEPQWLELTRTRVAVGRNASGRPLRILHLSDLHASTVCPLSLIEEAIRLGLATQPELVVLTGDFVTGSYDNWEPYAAVLRRLSEAAPTYACLGNHDGGAWVDSRRGWATSLRVQGLLRRARIELLHNRTVTLQVGDRDVQLTGVGDLWAGECQPLMAFPADAAGPADALRLVLNHNPDAKDLFDDYAWDLMLCGHTHGGQLKLPLIGTPFAPVRDKRYVAGLHPWHGRQIYITRGVGNLHGVRFNCRPEVSVLEIA